MLIDAASGITSTGALDRVGDEGWVPFGDPVFVLCNGRSGSTLLRFLLDAHPELACPPETNLPVLCAQLATVWSLIEGAPLSAERGDEPPEVPGAAIAGVRETMDRMVGSYLARRGKKRYCDKSLGTSRYAELLLRVYPQARFICLYRHPMDVIASGLEACPWGLNGYGFEPYIAATPGNAVMALASFWADNVRTTLAVEERFSDKCMRLRYEDLVADPEATAARLFEFLGVSAAPEISQACFSRERERFGPADHKIWFTSEIRSDSVGRGWSVPAGMIGPQLLALISEMTGELGYLAVDGDWGTTEPPADLRVPLTVLPNETDEKRADAQVAVDASGGISVEGDDGAALKALAQQATPMARADAPTSDGEGAGRQVSTGSPVEAPAGGVSAMNVTGEEVVASGLEASVQSEWLGERLRAGLDAAAHVPATERWGSHNNESFVAVVVTRTAERPAEYWLVNLAKSTVTLATRNAQENSDWDMVGAVDAWHRVIDRGLNLSVALRSCELRYCDNGEASPLATETRIWILGQLLGLGRWR